MPNKKSAKKRVKQNLRDEIRNRAAKAQLRTSLKAAKALVQGSEEGADTKVREVQSLAARLWKRGVLHKNKAARVQSRLMKAAQAAKSAE